MQSNFLRWILLFVAGWSLAPTFAVSSAAEAEEGAVSFSEKTPGELEVRVGDRLLTVLNHGEKWKKPFLYPLYSTAEVNVLRPIIPTKAEEGSSKEGTDHFHHKGVWCSVDSVNSDRLNFWHEAETIRCREVRHKVLNDGSGEITLTNDWMADGSPLLTENTTIRIFPSGLFCYTIRLNAVESPVTFFDTKEGFFAIRIAHTMRETEGGEIVNSLGDAGESECWGKPAPWVGYSGESDGSRVGVVMMDHPANFRPARYHVRAYGLFGISPFGPNTYSRKQEPESPVRLDPDQGGLTLRYGLLVHDGPTDAEAIEKAYDTFVQAAE